MAKKQTLEEKVKIEFCNCRYKADCMALLVKKYRKYDERLNIFVALTSSGSIASWAIWQEYAFIWGAVIAISQLVNALRPIYPFSKHVHNLNTRCYKLEALFLELEDLWYKVTERRIEDSDADVQLYHLKKSVAENAFFDDDDNFEFPQKIIEEARGMTSDTMCNNYNIQL